MSQSDGFGDLLKSLQIILEKDTAPTTPKNSLFDYLSRPINVPTNSLASYMTNLPKPNYLPPITPVAPRAIFPLPTIPKTQDVLVKRITSDTQRALRFRFTHTEARKVPAPADIAFNEAKTVETSVLHIDIRDSSDIVESFTPENALKIYKIFHNAMVLIARFYDGRIRTFAGDRIGVVFDIEDYKRSQAVKTGLLMQYVLESLINPMLEEAFSYSLNFGIGIDFGKMVVGKVGSFGSTNNDLVWAGKAMNTASKIADLDTGVIISERVHSNMDKELKEEWNMIWQEINSPKFGKLYKFVGTFLPTS